MSITIKNGPQDIICQFKAFWRGRPSWLNHGDGYKTLSLDLHREAKWITLISTEGSDVKRSSKTTMLTLEEPVARALYQFLKQHYE